MQSGDQNRGGWEFPDGKEKSDCLRDCRIDASCKRVYLHNVMPLNMPLEFGGVGRQKKVRLFAANIAGGTVGKNCRHLIR